MKNRKYRVILITMISVMIMLSLVCAVNAAVTQRGTMSISCDTKVITPGSEITIKFNYSEQISGGRYELVYDKSLLTWISTDPASSVRSMRIEDTLNKDVVLFSISDPNENSTAMPTVKFKVNDSAKEGDKLSVSIKVSEAQISDAYVQTIIPSSVSAWNYTIPSSNADCSGVSITLYKSAQDRDANINGTTKNLTLSGGKYTISGLAYTSLYYRLNVTPASVSSTVKYDAQNGFFKTGTTNKTGFTITSQTGTSVRYEIEATTLACGHNFEVKSVKNVAETCTVGSHTLTTYKCSICSTEKSEKSNVAAAPGHNYETQTVEADCENEGYTLHKCTKCGNSYKDETVPALGHDYVVKSSTSTCGVLGETIYECSRCKNMYTEKDTEVREHAYTSEHTDSTCLVLGKTVYTCSNCGDTYTENETELSKHTEKTEITPATCRQSAWVKTVCTVCGTVISQGLGEDAKGHSFGEWTIVVAATSESEGMMKRNCSECDEFETERIPKLGDDDIGNGSNNKGMLILLIILIIGIILLIILLIITYLTYRKKREAIQKNK